MKADKTFADEVMKRSGQDIHACYQCLKCFVGCPVAAYMDYKPNTVIRMIQYGEREKVLKSHAIWLCVSCMTCGARCPNDVDMSAVFDTLREMSREAGYAHEAERTVVVLHEEFVRNVKLWGRLHEVTFFIPHMLRSLDLFSNLPSGLALMARGKLPFIPKQIDGIEEIWRLYREGYKTKGELGQS
ncbi:MAG: 4Fe-4S dicluster domain-containing protein [Kiritimatiellae bacterium]|nr:4Fe-4S dicluster domain-containing protein [Kiritimatiellia bacterium]